MSQTEDGVHGGVYKPHKLQEWLMEVCGPNQPHLTIPAAGVRRGEGREEGLAQLGLTRKESSPALLPQEPEPACQLGELP